MIRKDGLIKILDFGLAKSIPAAASPVDSTRVPTQSSLTEPGVVLGTVGYMSPEQAVGKPAGPHSDQFSLGAIFYEMATGRRAFQRSTPVETLTAILRDEPEPIATSRPDAPEPLRWIIERCLAKEPGQRYASTRDLARDLARLRERPSEASAPAAVPRRWAASRALAVALVLAAIVATGWLLVRTRSRPTTAVGHPSIAILPFQNLGGRKDDEYFSDGMTESLITGLARVPGLLVIARNSAFQYKDRTADVRDVGRALGVRYVLEGSVQREGDSVRVHAQLVDSHTGYHLWADKYDRPTKDIFAVQDDISRHIVGSLRLTLSPGLAGTPAPPTKNLDAYDAYLRGVHYLHQMEMKEQRPRRSAVRESGRPRSGLCGRARRAGQGLHQQVLQPRPRPAVESEGRSRDRTRSRARPEPRRRLRGSRRPGLDARKRLSARRSGPRLPQGAGDQPEPGRGPARPGKGLLSPRSLRRGSQRVGGGPAFGSARHVGPLPQGAAVPVRRPTRARTGGAPQVPRAREQPGRRAGAPAARPRRRSRAGHGASSDGSARDRDPRHARRPARPDG